MFIIRKILGAIILFLNRVFTPKSIIREASKQTLVDEQTSRLKLYQFSACPFCVKVRREMKRLSLDIETRDAMNNPKYRQELETQGGRIKVPCLRIEDTDGNKIWLYDSSEIIKYLQKNFLT